MGRTSKTFASLLILLFVLSSVTFQPLTVKAQNKTITVPDDYPTIQWAIDNSNVGDTIFVKNGIYSESITINKAIRVLGESTENTIINGTTIVITINSNDVFLDGFTIVCWNKCTEQYGDRVEYHDAFHLSTGISLKGSNSTVSNNIIVNAKSGSSQLSASKNNLINNIIIDSSCGISLSLSKETKILSNIFSDSETAISLDASSNNRIFNNTIINQLQDSIRLSSQSNYNEIPSQQYLKYWQIFNKHR